MMNKILQTIINLLWVKLPTVRVVERLGAGNGYYDREDYGTVVECNYRPIVGYSDYPIEPWWLIRWDGDRKNTWIPQDSFRHRDEHGTWVRII